MKKPTWGSALIPSPRRGRTKVGVIGLIGSRAPLSLPSPIKGKGGPSKIETKYPIFSSSAGEHKIMNHFVVVYWFLLGGSAFVASTVAAVAGFGGAAVLLPI